MVVAGSATSEDVQKDELSIVGAGRTRSLAREARDHMREEPNLHLDLDQRDVTDDAVTLGTSCRCVVKEPSRGRSKLC